MVPQLLPRANHPLVASFESWFETCCLIRYVLLELQSGVSFLGIENETIQIEGIPYSLGGEVEAVTPVLW